MPNPLYFGGHSQPVPIAAAAAGTNQATAQLIVNGVLNLVSGASGANGVQLPVAAAGDVCRVYSQAATNALLVYAQTAGAINAGAANAAFSGAAQTVYMFECIDGLNWVVK